MIQEDPILKRINDQANEVKELKELLERNYERQKKKIHELELLTELVTKMYESYKEERV